MPFTKMILTFILFVSVLTISRPASAQAFGEVLARDDSETSFPEPLIFHNVTMNEFAAKMLEHRSTSLKKRAPLGHETVNSADQQALVEEWAARCRERYGTEYHIRWGTCLNRFTMEIHCDKPSAPVRTRTRRHSMECSSTAERQRKCELKAFMNYKGNPAHLPYCADIIPIREKEKEVDVVPKYDGYLTLPDEVRSPGTIDAFYEMSGVPFPALTGSFEYRGHHSSGKEFRSLSPKQAHSWACLGCPAGILYVSTVGYTSEAVGFSVPAGSWY